MRSASRGRTGASVGYFCLRAHIRSSVRGDYYIGVAGKDGRGREIRFYDFPSRGSRLIQALGNADIHIGLTVSPDRKIFLYSVAGDNGRNLMLVENFL